MLKIRQIHHRISIEFHREDGGRVTILQARDYALETMANRVMEFNVGWKETGAELNHDETRATIRFEK